MPRSLRKTGLRRAQEGHRRRGGDAGERRLVTVQDPASVEAEAYRNLRTNLLYAALDDPPKVIVVTSPGPAEGKSTTCANLGVVLAQAAKSTLLLDCDFRKPVVHEFFELRNLYGIVNVLLGERTPQEVWNEPVDGLKVLPVGLIPPNPTEILGSRRFSDLLGSLRGEFDHVLIDAPPVMPVSDPLILATQGDGVLLVLDMQSTHKGALRQAVDRLRGVGANVIGTVANNVTLSDQAYYYGGYSYKYGH